MPWFLGLSMVQRSLASGEDGGRFCALYPPMLLQLPNVLPPLVVIVLLPRTCRYFPAKSPHLANMYRRNSLYRSIQV